MLLVNVGRVDDWCHNQISVSPKLTCSCIKVNKVLIDGGAVITLLPERMLVKVGKYPDDLIPTNIFQ